MQVLDLLREVYIFAQTLDNAGATEYWVMPDRSGRYEKLTASDSRLREIRAKLDLASAGTRHFPVRALDIDGKTSLTGECVITIRPLTLDVDGRVSPVLVLFNVLGSSRQQAAAALLHIPHLLGRTFSQAADEEIDRLQHLLRQPWFVLLPRLFFAKLWTPAWNPISLK